MVRDAWAVYSYCLWFYLSFAHFRSGQLDLSDPLDAGAHPELRGPHPERDGQRRERSSAGVSSQLPWTVQGT